MRALVAAVLAIGLSGCATLGNGQVDIDRLLGARSFFWNLLGEDARQAVEIMQAAAPLLPPGDPWAECFAAVAETQTTLEPVVRARVRGGLSLLAKMHVVDSLSQNPPPELRMKCSAVAFDIMTRLGKGAMPGF